MVLIKITYYLKLFKTIHQTNKTPRTVILRTRYKPHIKIPKEIHLGVMFSAVYTTV